MKRKIIIVDTTLRDGEQQALINFNKEQKLELAEIIKNIGVDFIDLMPISNYLETEVCESLQKYPLLLSTPLTDEAIGLSSRFNQNIVFFQAVSDDLLKIRNNQATVEDVRRYNIERFKEILPKIKEKTQGKIKIFIAGEDSSRANLDYLISFIKSVQEYIDGFFFCDSIGYLISDKTTEIISKIKKEITCMLGIHTHNDLGFADKNTVEAVLAGADIISGTFTGIGERAGNANLGNVVKILREKGIILDNINYSLVEKAEKLVYKFAKRKPAKPFSKEAFYVETGMHVNALLDSPVGYSLFNPALLGFEHEVFFGKKCGISNFRWYFKDKFSDEDYATFRDKIKKVSIEKNKSFSFNEAKKILNI